MKTSLQDQIFMAQALLLAEKGVGWVNPNPKVGALLVKGQRVLGEGFHPRVGAKHAEIRAIASARRKGHSLKGSTLYVTLEPCCHTGRTPPCTKAIIAAGIGRVVIATEDPNPRVSGKGIAELRKHKVKVEVGCLKERAQKQNLIYRHWITQTTPFVALKMSVSLDGKISPAKKEKGKVFYLVGEEALNRVHQMRHEYDAICVGIKTLLQDDPQLTTRVLGKKLVRHPRPIILDRLARTPLTANILTRIPGREPPLIVVGFEAPQGRLENLRQLGAEILQVSQNDFGLNLLEVLHYCSQEEITSLMVEGGARVAESFLSQSLVNHIDIALSPMVIGPTGISMLPPRSSFRETDRPVLAQMANMEVEKLGSDFWVSGSCTNALTL